MAFDVQISPAASRDIRRYLNRFEEWAPLAIEEWHSRLIQAIETLSDMPRLCTAAPESRRHRSEIRQLLWRICRVAHLAHPKSVNLHELCGRHLLQLPASRVNIPPARLPHEARELFHHSGVEQSHFFITRRRVRNPRPRIQGN